MGQPLGRAATRRRRAGAAHEHWAQFAHEFVEAHEAAVGSRAEVAAAQQALQAEEADSDVCLDHEAAEARAEALAQPGAHRARHRVDMCAVRWPPALKPMKPILPGSRP